MTAPVVITARTFRGPEGWVARVLYSDGSTLTLGPYRTRALARQALPHGKAHALAREGGQLAR
jgi:hypothetical protein